MNTCISCGNTLSFFGLNSGIKIYRCSKCGLGVTEDKFKENYNAYHRDDVYQKEEKQFSNIFLKRVWLISKFKKPGKVLEIGSSNGLLLSLLKERGWEVVGIEPSMTSAKYANERGIKTYKQTFEKTNFASNSFDLIVLNHVLEHLVNPTEDLNKTYELLKKDGVMLIDVPNFGSLIARVAGSNWKYLLPKEHLWHFTKCSLYSLLKKTGFIVKDCQTHSGLWGYGSPLRELWESLIGGKKRFFFDVVTLIPTFFVTKLGYGSGLTVIAKKYNEK